MIDWFPEQPGENLGVFFYDQLKFRAVERTFPSIAMMLPDPLLYPLGDNLIVTPNANYSAHDYKTLFHDLNYDFGYEMWQNATRDNNYLNGPTGVDNVLCIHSSHVSTMRRMTFDQSGKGDKGFPDAVPNITFDDGDGTVPAHSLENCRIWKNTKHVVILGVTHRNILNDKRFLSSVWQVLGK
ncbi:unnamed protein product [Calicophoron daubneyi]|uniref:Uncharacterized protein n=1 Tax=Calicophoron daubneyi TaxID=300641 RepID=A0AAV2SZ12_CALDB